MEQTAHTCDIETYTYIYTHTYTYIYIYIHIYIQIHTYTHPYTYAYTDVNDSIEDVNDFLFMASAAAVVNSLDLSSAEIANREIKTWKTLSSGQESCRRVMWWCCASFPLVGCVGVTVGEACTCYSCNFNSSRALVFHGG